MTAAVATYHLGLSIRVPEGQRIAGVELSDRAVVAEMVLRQLQFGGIDSLDLTTTPTNQDERRERIGRLPLDDEGDLACRVCGEGDLNRWARDGEDDRADEAECRKCGWDLYTPVATLPTPHGPVHLIGGNRGTDVRLVYPGGDLEGIAPGEYAIHENKAPPPPVQYEAVDPEGNVIANGDGPLGVMDALVDGGFEADEFTIRPVREVSPA